MNCIPASPSRLFLLLALLLVLSHLLCHLLLLSHPLRRILLLVPPFDLCFYPDFSFYFCVSFYMSIYFNFYHLLSQLRLLCPLLLLLLLPLLLLHVYVYVLDSMSTSTCTATSASDSVSMSSSASVLVWLLLPLVEPPNSLLGPKWGPLAAIWIHMSPNGVAIPFMFGPLLDDKGWSQRWAASVNSPPPP